MALYRHVVQSCGLVKYFACVSFGGCCVCVPCSFFSGARVWMCMMQTARKGSESMFAHADYLRCFGAMTLCDGVSANFLTTLDKAELDRFVEILSMFVW